MNRHRVLLADDHKMILHGLQAILEPEFEIVAMVEDGRELIAKTRDLCPDILVVDIAMPFFNGIEAVREVRKFDKHVKIVFLTMQSDPIYAAKAFEAGAMGYVLKHSAPSDLTGAIHAAVRGHTYVSPQIAGPLMDLYKAGAREPRARAAEKGESGVLTQRQREILCLLAEGLSAKEIAVKLNISKRTVESHKYRMMEQCHLKNTAELVGYAVKCGIIPGSSQRDPVLDEGESAPVEDYSPDQM